FAARFTQNFIIGITGSNGKTTTTNLTQHLLVSSEIDAVKCGNVGKSFARQVAERDAKVYVLELSSFQLDNIVNFKPQVSILLNISPDHLDRYDNKMENYVAAKFRICMNQTENELFIYNDKDEAIDEYMNAHNINANLLRIGDQYFQDGKLQTKQQLFFDTNKLSIQGKHNMQNSICAIEAALVAGANSHGIQKGLDTFINDPHRMEEVVEINGVVFINDSKATNVDSVYYALDAIEQPIIWIVGGKDKGNDYEVLFDLVQTKVKAIICLGKDNSKLVATFSSQVKILEDTDDVDKAVEWANSYAEAGDVVLLSPACASFDLFDNYEHRGDEFKRAVKDLKK
ncbi:MAG: UDP-N-acetylmuramoyl-L-alanine--D-glutamate ligase, partial [Bacteroidota bacterium]